MSVKESVAKLSSPLKELVLGATQEGTQHYGRSEKDSAQIVEWIDKLSQGDISKVSSLKDLNAELTPTTYIVSNHLTAADVILYATLHPVVSRMQGPELYTYPSLIRYFDHIQSCPSVRKAAEALPSPLPFITLDLDSAPKLDRKVEPAKKKVPKAVAAESSAPTPLAETAKAAQLQAEVPVPLPTEGKAQSKKKEKKAGSAVPVDGDKKKAAGGGKAPVTEDSGEPMPSMIDLRVGHVVEIMKHPDADGLYVEQIDLGEETGPRTVVSGLVKYIPMEDLRNKYLVAVCNLKPATMRGVKSAGMVLCAVSKLGREAGLELIEPPPNSKPGDKVYFEGSEYEEATPLSQLNPKKKIFETIQPGFTTLDTREAAWINPVTKSVHRIRTKVGVCVAPTLVDANLS